MTISLSLLKLLPVYIKKALSMDAMEDTSKTHKILIAKTFAQHLLVRMK
jgi:hypothetical protein